MPLARSLHTAAILSLALLSSACRDRSPAASSASTAPTTAPTGPRIVSTVPAATLNLVLIGAADRLVGVSKYDLLYLPEGKNNLPVVGDYETMNYEQLVGLHPTTLIIQTAESRIPARLKDLAATQHIQLVNLRFDHVQDIWTSVRELGQVAGIKEQAEAAIDKAQAELKELAEQYKNAPHPKVVYLVSPKLMLLCGGHTFIDEMITAAGGQNAGAIAGDGFLDVGRETLVKLAPEVLLIGALEEPATLENDPRLATWLDLPVPAAKNKRVYLVTDGNSLMASVNIGKNVRALADLIHRGDPPTTTPTGATQGAASGGGTGGGP